MATAELMTPEPAAVPAKFSPSDAAIAKLSERYMPLTIAGIDDTEGFREVHSARMVCKNHRVDIEKTRKALKEDALKFGRIVDGEAKRLTALLEPIETHLETEEKRVADEKERIKNAARLKLEAEAKVKREAEEARIKAEQQAEAARLRVEREKLEADRAFEAAKQRAAQAKMDAERLEIEARQKAEQEKIDAQRRAVEAEAKRLADIEAARLHAIEIEKAKAEAAERSKQETLARIKREAEEVKRKAEVKEAARIKREAMKPVAEKLRDAANTVASVPHPGLPEDVDLQVRRILNHAADEIRAIAIDIVGEI